MRFTKVVLAYFVIGAVMWGGGAITWGEAGVGEVLIDDPTAGAEGVDESQTDQLEGLPSVIGGLASTVSGGGLQAALGLLSSLFGVLAWPVAVLHSNGAPPSVTMLLGGSMTTAFYVSIIRALRGSA
jgi:hypothetical protein